MIKDFVFQQCPSGIRWKDGIWPLGARLGARIFERFQTFLPGGPPGDRFVSPGRPSGFWQKIIAWENGLPSLREGMALGYPDPANHHTSFRNHLNLANRNAVVEHFPLQITTCCLNIRNRFAGYSGSNVFNRKTISKHKVHQGHEENPL